MSDKVVVLDNGSGLCKIGFGGYDRPICCFPSIVGHNVLDQEDPSTDKMIGNEACARAEVLSLAAPIKRGIITNWDDMVKIWDYAFRDLGVDTAQSHLLITDHYNEFSVNKTQREKIMEIMFETFSVPSFCVQSSTKLALYGTGRTTGVVIDCGDGVTDICCFTEGYAWPNGHISLGIGGQDVTTYLQKCLNERGYSFGFSVGNKVVRDIKEKHGYVALDFDEEMKKAKQNKCNVNYDLSSGEKITISSERFRCSEILFNPQLWNFEFSGIHKALFKSVLNCGDEETRKTLFENIVLSGGTTMFPGFSERIEKEITRFVPEKTKVHVISHEVSETNRVWVGGSVLVCLATFPQMVVTRKAYDDNGPGILHTMP